MEISHIVNQISLIISKLILTISFIYLSFKKYENKENVNIPIPALVMLLTYCLIILISFISMGEINILFILFYTIIFFCIIVLLLLSLDNFNLKNIIKNTLKKYIV